MEAPVADCKQLEALVQDCIEKHLYSSASFFADKLVALSRDDPGDVYLLAQTLFVSKQYRRTLHLLQSKQLVEKDARFRYLGAKCLAACQEWSDCLAMLGDGEGEEDLSLEQFEDQGLVDALMVGAKVGMYSAICLLRGQVYVALENRTRAIRWLKNAVLADPYCYEAFAALTEGHMLTSVEEMQLLAGIRFPPEARWLELMYRCKCKKYEQEDAMEAQLRELEGNPGAAAEATPAGQVGQPSGRVEVMADGAGCGLKGNTDVLSCKADWFYHRGQYHESYAITSELLITDPFTTSCLPIHLSSALQLKKKSELFLRGHRLVEEYPDRAVSWYAVGCYHACVGQHDSARRYFGKCTALEPSFVPAWLAFGNAFAAKDETDQAMAAYRTAARLFPGLHLPVLGIGMEYQRKNNLSLAKEMFLQVQSICPRDPLVCNELGVLLYRNGEYSNAEAYLQRALKLVPQPFNQRWEPTIVNLAHVLRKQRRYGEALDWYETGLGLCPNTPGTYAAMGYTQHLAGQLSEAIENYHKALGLRPDDSFTAEMLTVALHEECIRFSSELVISDGLDDSAL